MFPATRTGFSVLPLGQSGLDGPLLGLHGLQGALQQGVQLPAQQLSAVGDDVAGAAGGELFVLLFLFQGLQLHVRYALGRAHQGRRADKAGELLGGEEDLLHHQLGFGQVGVVVAGVALDGAD